jgi:NAD(P)-dependent dehydrogenase (short-subunit alcohol dehydrogenase family)
MAAEPARRLALVTGASAGLGEAFARAYAARGLDVGPGGPPRRPARGARRRAARSWCKAHELDNLYVVDTSFFVTSASVNPTLTTVANAMRVGDHLIERLDARVVERTVA